MTLNECARLAFKYIVSNKTNDYEAILATIPKQTYIMTDPAFSITTAGLYYAGLIWGFEYQKEQGLNTSYLGILAIIDNKIDDEKLKQARIEAAIKYQHSCDKLDILFTLVDELDKSHGLDTKMVYGMSEVRCIAANNKILVVDGDLPMRTLAVKHNPNIKNKNQACKDYYLYIKELLLMKLNEYETVVGSKRNTDFEAENEILKAKLKRLEAVE